MKRWYGWGQAICLSALALALAVPALAQGGSWVTVVRKQGTVESRLASSSTWLRILTNRRLGSNDWARTLPDSAAQVRLADSSLVAMGPLTQVQMERFTLTSRDRDTRVVVRQGSVRAQVSGFSGGRSRFQVSTPNAVLAAQGTDFLVTVDNPEEMASEDGWVQAAQGGPVVTRVAVFHGRVAITNQRGQTFLVFPGGTAEVVGGDAPNPAPPGFDFPQAEIFLQRTPGLGDMEAPGSAPVTPLEFSTLEEHFGSDLTGLTNDSKAPSTGRTDEGVPGGAPILVNPQTETSGTLIIEFPSSSVP